MKPYLLAPVLFGVGCAGVSPTRIEKSQPQSVIAGFVSSAESGDFESAYRLLAGPLRAKYTPARLREDFQLDPLARERVDRLRRAVASPPLLDGQGASFPLENGGVARLVREGTEFRIASLE